MVFRDRTAAVPVPATEDGPQQQGRVVDFRPDAPVVHSAFLFFFFGGGGGGGEIGGIGMEGFVVVGSGGEVWILVVAEEAEAGEVEGVGAGVGY